MCKGMKITIRVALILLVVGIVVMLVGGMMMGFDFKKIDTATYVKRNDTVTDAITDIQIKATSADVRVLPSSDGICRVESYINEKLDYSVSVKDGKLTVTSQKGKWYDYISMGSFKEYICVYLPEAQYGALEVDVSSGDVTMQNVMATDVRVETASGDVKVTNTEATRAVKVDVSSGDVTLRDVKATDVRAETISGDVTLQQLQIDSLGAETTSGDIEVKDLIASGNIRLETTSGDIEFFRMDGATLDIDSSSGDVKGTLLSVKHFVAKATSGDVEIPDSDSGAGICRVKTTSGDIKITIAK